MRERLCLTLENRLAVTPGSFVDMIEASTLENSFGLVPDSVLLRQWLRWQSVCSKGVYIYHIRLLLHLGWDHNWSMDGRKGW